MVTIEGSTIKETKTFLIDKDGIGRILLPKIMTQASGLRQGQLIEFTCESGSKHIVIKAKNHSGGEGGG